MDQGRDCGVRESINNNVDRRVGVTVFPGPVGIRPLGRRGLERPGCSGLVAVIRRRRRMRHQELLSGAVYGDERVRGWCGFSVLVRRVQAWPVRMVFRRIEELPPVGGREPRDPKLLTGWSMHPGVTT